MAEAAKPEAGDSSSGELESMQSAAKWLVGAGAAVMTVLVAGLQLSTLARLTFDSPTQRTLALLAILVGLLAVGRVLVLAARVLVHPGWTMSKLAHLDSPPGHEWNHHWLRDELGGQRRLLVPGEDQLRPSKLYDRGHDLLSAWYDLYEKGSVSIGTPPETYQLATAGHADRLTQRLSNIQQVNKRLTEAANLAAARRRYKKLTKWLPWMGSTLVGAVGVLVYLAATSSDVQLTAPVGVTVQFVPDQAALANAGIPSNCANRTVLGVAVGGSLRHPVVVTTDKDCTLNQVSVPTNAGIVVPKVPDK